MIETERSSPPEKGLSRLAQGMYKRAFRILAGCLITLAATGHVYEIWQLPGVDGLDRALYDTTVKVFLVPRHDDRIAIVDIEESSLARLGRWPWPREHFARLIEELIDRQGAAVVGLDVVLSEPERNPVESFLKYADAETAPLLRRLAAKVDNDRRLADVLRGRPVVLGYYLTSDRDGHRSGELPPPLFSPESRVQLQVDAIRFNGFGANLPLFAQSAYSSGYFNPVIDPDGKVRAVPLLAELDGGLYESFALAIVRTYLGGGLVTLRPGELGVRGERGVATAPIDDRTAAWVPFFGAGGAKSGASRYLSASDVIEGRIPPLSLKGRIVLVGTTSPGLSDIRPTPVAATFPGVEIHANLIRGLLKSRVPHTPQGAKSLTVALTIGLGLAMTLSMPWLGAMGVFSLAGIVTALLIFTYGAWYSQMGWIVPIGSVLVMIVALAIWMTAAGYIAEGRIRRQLVRLFGEYLPPEIVRRISRDPTHFRAEGELRTLTVMFADLSGFTGIAESMPPNELRALLNTFLSAMSEQVFAYGGTLDKYIGDAVMAFWGAPIDDEHHVEHAVLCALSMKRTMHQVNLEGEMRGWPKLTVGIGINTGAMRVGDMGSSLRRTYTVIGDAVNVAARLQELSKVNDHRIIVGGPTHRALHGRVPALRFESLGQARLQGRSAPVDVFAVAEIPAVEAELRPDWVAQSK